MAATSPALTLVASQRPSYLLPNFDNMPPLLTERRQWVLWRTELRGGRWSKIPFQTNGRVASATDANTWSSFDACRTAFERGHFDGVGFVLDGQRVDGKQLIGVDIDKLSTATARPPELDALLAATYQEKSPSAAGVRAFVLADNALTMKLDARDGWPGVEIYTTARYLTVTGQGGGHIAHGSLADLTAALALHPARASRALGSSTQQTPNFTLPPSFTTDRSAALVAMDPGFLVNASRFSAGWTPSHCVEVARVAHALMHLARAGCMAGEGDWKDAARAVARCASREPMKEGDLWQALDIASRVAGGNYDEDENRKHFDRFVREAPTRSGYDDRSVFSWAARAGWMAPQTPPGPVIHQPTPMPVAAALNASLLPPPRKRRWLHGNDIVRGAVSLVVAPGGAGKTGLLLGMALACATGKPLMGSHVFALPGEGLRVLYINAEDGSNEIALRLHAAMTRHGLARRDVANLVVAGVDQVRLTLMRGERGDTKSDEDGWAKLEGMVAQYRPDVLILDPLANLSSATLNDNHAATMLMSRLTALAVSADLGIVVAHHTAKGRDLASQEAASGAAAIVNSARLSLSLEPLTAAVAPKVGVHPSDARSYFSVGHTKANLAPPGERRWFKMISQDVPNAEPPTYPNGDSVQVVMPFTPNPTAVMVSPAILRAALECVGTASPPLSPSPRSRDRNARTAIASALTQLPESRGREEPDAMLALETLIQRGWIAEEAIKVPKAGRGHNASLGYVVRENPLWPAPPSEQGA